MSMADLGINHQSERHKKGAYQWFGLIPAAPVMLLRLHKYYFRNICMKIQLEPRTQEKSVLHRPRAGKVAHFPQNR
jgi:hypothetical protein